MRTLVVTNDFPPRTGGIESFVLAMVQRMDPGAVVVHTARQDGAGDFDAAQPFPVVRDPSRLLVPTRAITARVVATARRHGCDRVWFGAAAPLALMAPALRRAGVTRMVATSHGHEVWWAAVPPTRAALHRIGDSIDVLTYLGDFTRSRIAPALSPTAAARMRQLTPGVDAAEFRPGSGGRGVRQQLGLAGRPVIVCVSRMVARKGQDQLVRALPAIAAQVPDVALLLVGDGPYRPVVEQLVDSHGVRDRVVFTGRVPWSQVPAHVDAGDVFAMPSRTRLRGLEPEGLGICYLEAAATGLPVVVGDSGGAPDAVMPGRNGDVVDGRSPAAIAATVSNLLLDRPRAKAYGAAGREWVQHNWGWDRMSDRLHDMLVGEDPDRTRSGRQRL